MSTSLKFNPVQPFTAQFIILVGTIATYGGTLKEAVANARNPNYVIRKEGFEDLTVTGYFMSRGYDGADVPHHLRNPQLGMIFTEALDSTPGLNRHFSVMESIIDGMARSYAESHMTNGEVWPNDAQFALVTRLHAWPIGWAKEKRVEFFKDRDSLDQAVALLTEFARYEDNFAAYQGYEWDLGPNVMADVAHNLSNL